MREKSLNPELLKLQNSVDTTKCLSYHLEIIYKLQVLKKTLKRAKTLKNQRKKKLKFFLCMRFCED